ncbi:MAG: polyisoprenoid-binding protein YceI [Saprospiraceae bacterium]|jgi:polyisoprenoid-binding protein YceI
MKGFMLFIAFMGIATLGGQKISETKSSVSFTIGNMRINTAEGTFTGMKGEVDFDEKNLKTSSFGVTIDAATVKTDSEKRDNHLKNEDFFDVKKYPTITFKSSAVVRSKKEGYYIAKGKLTMHGVTKDVKIPFTYGNKTFKGRLKVKRLDYGVGADTGTFMVSDEAVINITCVTE